MFDTVCSYPLSSDIFAQAIHPSEPIVSVGLSSGHVETFRLPASSEGAPKNGHIDTLWRTRRHKGSCRCLGYGTDGQTLYSAGTDGWVKVAKAETGVVETKIAVPRIGDRQGFDDPSVIHALSPQSLLLATDSGALHVYDLRIPSTKVSARPQQTYTPHDDYVSSLTPLPPSKSSTSGFSKQWVTTGGTTIAVTDLRKGVIRQSENQEEELVSSCYVTGLKAGRTSQGEKLVVGGASGVLTLWEKGAWDDQDERITVDRGPDGGESLEVLTVVPDELGKGKMVAVGQTDGRVQFVQLGRNQTVFSVQHDELEGVVGLGFDVAGRMVSGGGSIVKVWQDDDGDHEEEEEDEEEDSDDEGGPVPEKRSAPIDSDDSDAADSDADSDDETNGQKNRKKRKKGKGKKRSGGPHVMAFKGLD
ncbi:WD repeat-containing protein JIP5 [Polytolypa hystricis UAMH7299]|uniref:WD repeat-containing protein JIP5 n=1 Tax=Polytolypa hystricis (strain UAMH7299) TaxID=1447883 RepID=A0A2B7Y9W7_POLH7|nr:WD repeat-containing protein JIP5 [Polytolypa hystricis UAMH7299]